MLAMVLKKHKDLSLLSVILAKAQELNLIHFSTKSLNATPVMDMEN